MIRRVGVEHQVQTIRRRFFKPGLRFASVEKLNGWLEASSGFYRISSSRRFLLRWRHVAFSSCHSNGLADKKHRTL